MTHNPAGPPPAPPAEPFAPGGGGDGGHPGRTRGSLLLLVAAASFVAVLALGFLVPLPYVVLGPGPALNTLGKDAGRDLISITGHPTYGDVGSGTLDLTTVSVYGGPGHRVSLFDVVQGWVDPDLAVVDQASVFPPNQTQQESDAENAREMTTSQEAATAAALRTLGIAYTSTLVIGRVAAGAPSAAVLRSGDQIVAFDGTAVSDPDALRSLISALPVGSSATLTVRRDGRRQDLTVRTRSAAGTGRSQLGVELGYAYDFPFQVKIQIEDIGGPSAGLMFALGIIDKLTPGPLTGGQRIAGTGTMDESGRVGAIGGIAQKMVGAHDVGARWFLAPADNCPDVRGHVPDGLHVVKVSTLDEARADVQRIAAGQAGALAGCG